MMIVFKNHSMLIEVHLDDDGAQEWFKNYLFDRINGPAVISSEGEQYWFCKGDYHREDGPAVIMPTCKQWWVNNNYIKAED